MEIIPLLLIIFVCSSLLIGYPVAFTLAGVSIIFALICSLFGIFDLNLFKNLPIRIFGIMNNQTLLAVPLFVLMASILERAGVAEDLFDPLAAYEGTNGWSGTEGVPGNPNLIDTETKVAISPRLGISHPISDQSVLHFQYGHFYQRPSWTKIFGFPYITFASGSHDELINPFDPANGTVHMDQWHGYYLSLIHISEPTRPY